MNELFYPERFIKAAISVGCPVEEDDAVLRRLVEILYLSSLLTEESHNCLMRVLLTDQGVNLGAEKRFVPPLALDPQELRKLAFLTNPEEMCIHVCRTDAADALIVGLGGRVPPAVLRDFDKHVEIEVAGPGSIRLRAGTGAVHYESVAYRFPSSEKLPTDWLPKAVPSAIHRYCLAARQEGTIPLGDHRDLPLLLRPDDALGQYSDLIRASAPGFAWDMIVGTAARASRGRRGGGLLVLDGQDTAAFATVRSSSRAIHRASQRVERWARPMIDSLIWGILLQLGQRGVQVVHLPVPLQEWVEDEGRELVRRNLERWTRALGRYADLTRVDGVLVLDEELEPIHVGTKLHGVGAPHYAPETATFLGQHSMRHKSMADAAWDLPNSLGVAVSQDGSVTLFQRLGGFVRHREMVV